MTRALLQQALEALDTAQALLECSAHHPKILNAYEAIRAELAKPEQQESKHTEAEVHRILYFVHVDFLKEAEEKVRAILGVPALKETP